MDKLEAVFRDVFDRSDLKVGRIDTQQFLRVGQFGARKAHH